MDENTHERNHTNCRCHLIPLMGRTEINQAQPFGGHTVDIKHKEGNDEMSIEIHVDKIKKYKLTGIDALHEDNLPNEYISCAPFFYKYGTDGDCLLAYYNYKTRRVHADDIYLGDEFTESEMRSLTHHIRLAGERLGRINQKIKRDTDKKKKETPPKPIDDWSGSYTFKV